MTVERIETDVVYDHEKYGNVLVTSIATTFSTWNADSGTPSENSTLVFFYRRFDDYGGFGPSPLSENVNDFAKRVTEVREFSYPGSEE